MKKEKKLVLRKLTVTSLDADKLDAVRGGKAADSIKDCTEGCGPSGGCVLITTWDWGCRG